MKTIEKYVFGSFLSSFALAFLVLSFVLTIGLLMQIIQYVMDGVSPDLIGRFCLVSLPETLQWSIPLALLVSSILVFSRMSADSEIAAMRACGVSIISVIRWPIIFAAGCTLLGLIVNNEVVPRGHKIRRELKTRVSVGAGLSVLEPGKIIDDFPNIKLYFESKEGNWLHDLVAYDCSEVDFSNGEKGVAQVSSSELAKDRSKKDKAERVTRMINANRALVTQEGADVNLDLYQMTVDPLDAKHPTMAHFARFVYTIKDVLKNEEYVPRTKDQNALGVLREMRQLSEMRDKAADSENPKLSQKVFLSKELSSVKVELMKRLVFAMASVCFVLIGVPLGIRSQRKESSVGMAISLAVALGYYVVVILMMSFEHNYKLHPEILIWLPVVISLALSAKFIRKHL